MQAAYPILRASLEKITARIAVSEDARRTLVEHLGGDAVVIPNGVYVDRFADASPRPDWQGTPDRPTVAFVGRIDEPRKGLPVLAAAVPGRARAGARARGSSCSAGVTATRRSRGWPRGIGAAIELLGPLGDADKAALLRSVDVYVAPHTGGESFGIVLVEAMSAGAPVLASDLGAFRRVLDDGALGVLFPPGDPAALASRLLGLLEAPAERRAAGGGRPAGRCAGTTGAASAASAGRLRDGPARRGPRRGGPGSRRLLTRWRS